MSVDGATLGMIGGIAGAAVGVAGGVVGTRASLKRARTPAERRLVVRTAAAIWAAAAILALVLALMLAGIVPYWAYLVVMCTFFVALGPGIAFVTRRERELHARERDSHGRTPEKDDATP